MNGPLLFIVLSIALVVVMLWQGLSPAKSVDRTQMDNGFEPGASNKERVLLILGIVGACFGMYQLEYPPHPPLSGVGSAISSLLFALFGKYGSPGLAAVLSVSAFIGAAVIKRRRTLARKKAIHAG